MFKRFFFWLRHRNQCLEACDLHERMARGEKFMVVDVRREDERQGPDGWIPGAVSVPLRGFKKRAPELIEEQGPPVVFVCSHGVRSLYALDVMENLERELYSLTGGMRSWCRHGFEVIRNHEAKRPAVPIQREC